MGSTPPPLHDLHPTTRFSDRASDYAQYRPSYPPGAIDAVLEGLGDPGTLNAADVGAGTGISSRLLAERGVQVIAVEPNESMRQAAEPHPRVRFVGGTAEATGLPPASGDLVTCFQAFHWFEPLPALREFHRILKPGGRLALVWNERDGRDAFTAGYRQALLDVGGEDPAERRTLDPGVITRSGLFSGYRVVEVANEQRLDADGLVGRAMSASYVPKTGPMVGRLAALLRELHDRHADADGRATLVYRTRAHLAERG